ncbi:MAG: glycosyltransferase [Planctomycetes bacterium]|nr:glycosyltransferase [Planctomycetota bacterium]
MPSRGRWRSLRRALRRPVRALRIRLSLDRRLRREDLRGDRVSIAVVTYNRLGFLRLALESLLQRTDYPGHEVLVWDNASTDGTADYLRGLADPRVRVFRHPENIGVNAYARVFREATGNYLVGMDDDVIWHPPGWLEAMLLAYRRLPRLGYLAANVFQDAYTWGAKEGPARYHGVSLGGGQWIELGPTGAWCSLMSRAVYDEVGGYRERPALRYWWFDRDLVMRMRARGYYKAILGHVTVYHAFGPHCNEAFPEHYALKMSEVDPADRHLDAPRGGFMDHFLRHYHGRAAPSSPAPGPTA